MIASADSKAVQIADKSLSCVNLPGSVASRSSRSRKAGRPNSLLDAAAHRSRRWFQGKAAARTAFM